MSHRFHTNPSFVSSFIDELMDFVQFKPQGSQMEISAPPLPRPRGHTCSVSRPAEKHTKTTWNSTTCTTDNRTAASPFRSGV